MADRRKVKLIVAIAAVVIVVAAVVVGALYASRGSREDLVKLELRAKPVATIRFKGKQLGRTPIVIQVPRSTSGLPVEATFKVHKLNGMNGAPKDEIWTQTVVVVPSEPQSVDFDLKAATKQPDPVR
jgi:hypothetical protein